MKKKPQKAEAEPCDCPECQQYFSGINDPLDRQKEAMNFLKLVGVKVKNFKNFEDALIHAIKA